MFFDLPFASLQGPETSKANGGVEQGEEGYPRAGDKSLGSWTKGPGGPEAGRLMPEDHRAGVGVGG